MVRFFPFILLILPIWAFAGDYKVFGVRTDFPMKDGQVSYRDIYVNIGTNQGVKTGTQLDAFRVITTVDELNQKTGQNIAFKVAHLKVIHAESEISVARVIDMMKPEMTPIGLYTNVMVGDQVELSQK